MPTHWLIWIYLYRYIYKYYTYVYLYSYIYVGDLVWKIRRQQKNRSSLPTGWLLGGVYPHFTKVSQMKMGNSKLFPEGILWEPMNLNSKKCILYPIVDIPVLCVSRCGTTVNDLFILDILQGSLCWKRCNVNGLWCVQSPGDNGIDGATTRRTRHIVAHQDLIRACYSNNYSWLDINFFLGGDSMIRCSNLSLSFPGMDRFNSGLRLKQTHGLQETFFTSDAPAGDLSSRIWPKKTMGTSCCVPNGPTDVFFQI